MISRARQSRTSRPPCQLTVKITLGTDKLLPLCTETLTGTDQGHLDIILSMRNVLKGVKENC